jgi:hypothetical protein
VHALLEAKQQGAIDIAHSWIAKREIEPKPENSFG